MPLGERYIPCKLIEWSCPYRVDTRAKQDYPRREGKYPRKEGEYLRKQVEYPRKEREYPREVR